jgi:hypothetical protein
MDSARKNRYRSTENFPLDQDASNCLAAFLRSSRSPSFHEAQAVAKEGPELLSGEVDQLRGHY